MCLSNTLYLHASVDVNSPCFPDSCPNEKTFCVEIPICNINYKKKKYQCNADTSFQSSRSLRKKTTTTKQKTRYLKLNVFLLTLNKHIKLAKKYHALF